MNSTVLDLVIKILSPVLSALIERLIREAEEKFLGSKLGKLKKDFVLTQIKEFVNSADIKNLHKEELQSKIADFSKEKIEELVKKIN